MVKKIFFIVLLQSVSFLAKVNANNSILPDSLENKSYEYFKIRYQEAKQDNIASLYANTWLTKSKKEVNYKEMALAYQAVMYKRDKKLHPAYTDSILNAALFTKDDAQIGAAFITKGSMYYSVKKYKLALDCYLKADEYIVSVKNPYLTFKLKYTIAQTKLFLGFYDEALALFTECLDFFKDENDRAYINTLHSIGLCYSKNKNYERSSKFNQQGIEAGKESEIIEMIPYFNQSEGINQYYLKNYSKSTQLLLKSLPAIQNRNDFANQMLTWSYLAKNYLASNELDKAIAYSKKVEEAMNQEDYIRPDFRVNLEILLNHYKKRGDLEKQLHYVNRLLHIDSIFHDNFQYLSRKIYKEYDTKKLIESKEHIETKLKYHNSVFIAVSSILLTSIFFLVYRHFRNVKKYKQKFEEHMSKTKKTTRPFTDKDDNTDPEIYIAPAVVNLILENLEKFEKNKKFLKKEMTAVKLGELLNTNSKYCSQVIRKHKHKRPFEYVRELRIEYIIQLLETEKFYRIYTNEALADLAGFSTTQNFTKAFKTHTGFPPTFFIKELQNREQATK